MNFNRVFELSSGKYFMWASYDDLWHQEIISTLVNILERHYDVVLAFSAVQRIDSDGVNIGKPLPITVGKSTGAPLERAADSIKRNSCSTIYGLIRSNILSKTNLFTDIGIPFDLGLLTELSCYGKSYITGEPLFFRRKHKEQFHKTLDDCNNRNKGKAVWTTNEHTLRWIESLPLTEADRKLFLDLFYKEIHIRNKGGRFSRKVRKWFKTRRAFVRKLINPYVPLWVKDFIKNHPKYQ